MSDRRGFLAQTSTRVRASVVRLARFTHGFNNFPFARIDDDMLDAVGAAQL